MGGSWSSHRNHLHAQRTCKLHLDGTHILLRQGGVLSLFETFQLFFKSHNLVSVTSIYFFLFYPHSPGLSASAVWQLNLDSCLNITPPKKQNKNKTWQRSTGFHTNNQSRGQPRRIVKQTLWWFSIASKQSRGILVTCVGLNVVGMSPESVLKVPFDTKFVKMLQAFFFFFLNQFQDWLILLWNVQSVKGARAIQFDSGDRIQNTLSALLPAVSTLVSVSIIHALSFPLCPFYFTICPFCDLRTVR